MDKEIIKAAEKRLSSLGGCPCKVTGVIDDPDNQGTLIKFNVAGLYDCCAYLYNSGELFTLYDWQGYVPERIEDLAEVEWLTPAGHRAVIIDGRPRIFAGE